MPLARLVDNPPPGAVDYRCRSAASAVSRAARTAAGSAPSCRAIARATVAQRGGRRLLGRVGGHSVQARTTRSALSGPLPGRPAVGGGAIRERASTHGEHAPGAQPSVKVGLHDPEYRQPRNDCCGGPCSAHRPRQRGQIILAATPRAVQGPFWAKFGVAAPVAGRRRVEGWSKRVTAAVRR